MMLVTPVTLGLTGSMFGGAQWLALGKSPRFGASWVGTSGLGSGVGMTVGIVLVETLGQALAATPVARRWVLRCVAGFGAGLPAGSCHAAEQKLPGAEPTDHATVTRSAIR